MKMNETIEIRSISGGYVTASFSPDLNDASAECSDLEGDLYFLYQDGRYIGTWTRWAGIR